MITFITECYCISHKANRETKNEAESLCQRLSGHINCGCTWQTTGLGVGKINWNVYQTSDKEQSKWIIVLRMLLCMKCSVFIITEASITKKIGSPLMIQQEAVLKATAVRSPLQRR